MRVGVPKEIKNHEYRAGLTPDSVRELVHRGHDVFVDMVSYLKEKGHLDRFSFQQP